MSKYYWRAYNYNSGEIAEMARAFKSIKLAHKAARYSLEEPWDIGPVDVEVWEVDNYNSYDWGTNLEDIGKLVSKRHYEVEGTDYDRLAKVTDSLEASTDDLADIYNEFPESEVRRWHKR